MPLKSLGTIRQIEISDIWSHEATDFTPWLAAPDNIALLGDALGIELEVEGIEQPVGPFKADILCRNLTNENKWVVIENQLGQSDHSHVGQLLTYTAGFEAATNVWIARKIRDEHRAVLDWLNENTTDTVDFFGVELEVWQIGDSAPAPRFSIVCRPNEWRETVATATRIVESQELSGAPKTYLEFWSAFRDHLELGSFRLKLQRPLAQGWYSFSVGKSNFDLITSASVQERYVRVEFKISGPHRDQRVERLLSHKQRVTSHLNESVDWHEASKAFYVRLQRDDCDLEDRSQWPEYHEWLAEKVELFRSIFVPLLPALVADTPNHDVPIIS